LKTCVPLHYGWVIVATAALVVFGSLGLGRFGLTMILPSVKAGLGLTDVQSGDLAVANMIGYLAMSLLSGALVARLGSRAMIAASMMLVAAGMLAAGLAAGYPACLLGLALTGLGSGGSNVPVMGLAAVWFSRSRRGRATGIVVSGSSVGIVLAGAFVPAVMERFGAQGWRVAWQSFAAVALGLGALGWLLLRDDPAAMGLEPVGGAEPAAPAAGGTRWSSVYRRLAVWHLGAAYLLFGFSYVIYATFFARYLTGEVGLTTRQAGSLWSAVGALSLASGFIWGSVSDRLGRRYGLALVFAVQGVCFAAFAFWRAPAGVYASAGLFAITAWSIPAVMAAATADIVGNRLAPAAFGFVTVFLGLGQAAGPFAAGRIAQAAGTYAPAFGIAAAAAACGALLSLLLRPATAVRGSPAAAQPPRP
jgi:MFS family permease